MARRRVTHDLPRQVIIETGAPPPLTEAQRDRFDLARAALDRVEAAPPVEPTEAERRLLRRMAGS